MALCIQGTSVTEGEIAYKENKVVNKLIPSPKLNIVMCVYGDDPASFQAIQRPAVFSTLLLAAEQELHLCSSLAMCETHDLQRTAFGGCVSKPLFSGLVVVDKVTHTVTSLQH